MTAQRGAGHTRGKPGVQPGKPPTRWRTRDGEWNVEHVVLTHTSRPHRDGDPDGDGEYLLVTHRTGFVDRYYKTVQDMAARAPFALEDLEEVPQ